MTTILRAPTQKSASVHVHVDMFSSEKVLVYTLLDGICLGPGRPSTSL